MCEEAEKYKDEDMKRKERIDSKNQYENMLYGTKNSMDTIPEASRPDVQKFLDEEFAWLEKQNIDTSADEFNKKIGEFNRKVSELTTEKPNHTPDTDIEMSTRNVIQL